MTKRPTCVHCGKPYGNRRTTEERVSWTEDQERPKYRGNLQVVEVREWGKQMSRASLAKAYGEKPSPYQQQELESAPEKTTYFGYYKLWDGETWLGGYKPFCTLRCALDYARKCFYERGEQTNAKNLHKRK